LANGGVAGAGTDGDASTADGAEMIVGSTAFAGLADARFSFGIFTATSPAPL